MSSSPRYNYLHKDTLYAMNNTVRRYELNARFVLKSTYSTVHLHIYRQKFPPALGIIHKWHSRCCSHKILIDYGSGFCMRKALQNFCSLSTTSTSYRIITYCNLILLWLTNDSFLIGITSISIIQLYSTQFTLYCTVNVHWKAITTRWIILYSTVHVQYMDHSGVCTVP